MRKVLSLLEKDGMLTPAQIAVMLDRTVESVQADIARAEASGALLGTRAVIDWEKVGGESVTAMIELHITPQRGEGFDRVARRIYQFEEVRSLYLMSGRYDLHAEISGRSLREVAGFVSEKLSALEYVTGTDTHFVLKKYKESGSVYAPGPEPQERVTFL